MICPSAVTHGSWRHAPAVPPQSASTVQAPKRFAAALVVQTLPTPTSPFSTYEPAIGLPTTIGAQLGAGPTLSSPFTSSVNESTFDSMAPASPVVLQPGFASSFAYAALTLAWHFAS